MEKFDDLTRRQFVATGLTAGFALAVQPISGWAISTSADDLQTAEVQIPVGSEKIWAYQAVPNGKNRSPLPLIIVVHEIFGVHEHIKDVVRRFAKKGFYAIAPNLYQRQGDVMKLSSIDEIKKVVDKVPADQVMKDLDATIEFAKKYRAVDENKMSITGFCWGGKITWLYAAHNPKLKAGGAWYGGLVGTTEKFPKAAVDVAPALTVPVLGLYGGKDAGITQEHVTQMRDALKKGKSGSEIKVYPEAPHGFHADYRESYRQADAENAFQSLLDWLKKHKAM